QNLHFAFGSHVPKRGRFAFWIAARIVNLNVLKQRHAAYQNQVVISMRRVAMAKARGDILGAIDWLNKYLEIFMADHDAWRELAEIYVSLQMYKQAAFCYEELILSQPMIPLHHLAYADVSISYEFVA
nr:ER membrane protein complex subunit 2 [Tanacetum cinerariifolium]